MNPLLTIIVPIYNREKYLRESLDSVLSQTYKNLEIILADDGSTDNSLNIMKEYSRSDSRIKIITHKNIGICETIRRAVLISNGDYIARCDSDDVNEVDRYEKQLHYLLKNDCDLVGCYIKAFGDGNDFGKKYLECCTNKPVRNYKQQRSRIMLGQPITGSTIMCKASTIKEIMPFKKENSLVEDFYITVLFHKHGKKIGNLEEHKVNYRVHKNNLSLSGDVNLIMKHTEVAFEHLYKKYVDNAKEVIMFKLEVEKEWTLEIIQKIFGDGVKKFKIVTEKTNKEKLVYEILSLQKFSDGKIVFYGMSFKNLVESLIQSGNYVMYENIFLSGS